MDLTSRREADTVVVGVTGEMDADRAYLVYQAVVEQAEDEATRRVVLDLAGVTFMDSIGLSMLIRCRDELSASGCGFALSACSERVTHLLTVTGVLDHFTIVAGVLTDRSAGAADAGPVIEDPDLAAGQFLDRPQP